MTERFCAVACEDGSLFAYSPAGRHLLNVKLDAPCYDLTARRDQLFVISINCQARVYDVRSCKLLFTPCSIAHIVTPRITRIDVRPNGTPIVITSEPAAYAYDSSLQDWTAICSTWFTQYSSLLSSSSRGGRGAGPAGPVSDIEHECVAAFASRTQDGEGAKSDWWDQALEMGHLECRMRAAVLLDSKEEYKFSVLRYASLVGRENFRGRAEELVRELIGTVYSHPGKEGKWSPTVIGLQKRELAKQVLSTLARESPAMAGLTQQYQALLKLVADEEATM